MPTKNRSLEDGGKRERAAAAKAANARERNIAQQYLNAGPSIGNLARAAYHWWNSVPFLGGKNETGLILSTGEAPSPGMRSPKDIAKTAKTVRELITNAKSLPESELDAVASIHKLKTFLQGKGYRKRLENYYRDKGSSIVTQKNAPDDRIGEQLYNIETAKLEVRPRGKLVGQDGATYDKSTRGVYDPETHTIQVDNEAVVGDVPRHEGIHARSLGEPYLDNYKYKMRTKWEGPSWDDETPENLASRIKLDLYYGDVVEQEPRILNTLAAMERDGYDINNLTDEQIYSFLYNRPIDLHGSDTQSLIDNYVPEDIPNALRNFKQIAIPLIAGGTGYTIGKQRDKKKSGGKINNNNMPKRRIHLDEVKSYIIPTDNIQIVRPDTTDVEYPNFVFSRNNPNFGIYTGLGYNAYGKMIDYNNNGVPASQEYIIDKIKTKYYKNPSKRRVNNAKKAIGVRPDFKNGGSIHIDPSKKGIFTAAASKHNMGVQEFASKVLRNKEDYSPAMVKKANFARNASKWNH